MASYAALGFAKGFFDASNKAIDEEQKKQDKLKEKLQEMHIKGLEKQQEKYDKMSNSYAQIKQHLDAGDTKQAYATYSQMLGGGGVKLLKEQLGGDWEKLVDHPQNIQSMRESYEAFQKMERPELNMEDLDKIQVRRGVENLSFEKGIRDMLGIEPTDEYLGTPFKGVSMPTTKTPMKVEYKKATSTDKIKTQLVEIKEHGENVKRLARINEATGEMTIQNDKGQWIPTTSFVTRDLVPVQTGLTEPERDKYTLFVEGLQKESEGGVKKNDPTSVAISEWFKENQDTPNVPSLVFEFKDYLKKEPVGNSYESFREWFVNNKLMHTKTPSKAFSQRLVDSTGKAFTVYAGSSEELSKRVEEAVTKYNLELVE